MTGWGIAPGSGDVLLVEHFEAPDLQRIRSDCYISCVKAGLDDDRAQMFVLAVNEGLTNAIVHGGGWGVLVLLSTDAGRLIAHVTDNGPGISREIPESLPPANSPGGRGLWTARHMVDELSLTSGLEGTTLRLEVAIASQRPNGSG